MVKGKEKIPLLVQYILYTSCFAAFCATILTYASFHYLKVPVSSITAALLVFVFCATILIYNLHYYFKDHDINYSDRSSWISQHRLELKINIVCSALILIMLLPFLKVTVSVSLAIAGILAVFYSFPVKVKEKRIKLRSVGWLKPILLSVIWTVATCVMAIYRYGILDHGVITELINRFLITYLLCIAFDIKDHDIDVQQNVKTIPVMLGVKKAYRYIDIVGLGMLCLSLLYGYLFDDWNRWWINLISILVLKLFLNYRQVRSGDWYHLLFIDGIFILYSMLLIIFY